MSWESKPLQSLMRAPIQYGIVQTGTPDRTGVPCMRVVDLTKRVMTLGDVVHVSPAIHRKYRKTTLELGDLLFTLRGDVGLVRETSNEFIGANIHRGVARLSVDPNLANRRYVAHALQGRLARTEIAQRLTGSALQELPIRQLRKLSIPVPPLELQRFIGTIMDDLEKYAGQLATLADAKRRFRRGFLQRTLEHDQFGDRHHDSLRSYFTERQERNTSAETDLVLSCTKGRGIIPQAERFSRRLASKTISHYKIARRGDLVFDPMLLWDGSYGFQESFDLGVVSPAYTVLVPTRPDAVPLLKAILETSRVRHEFRRISKGTNQRRRKAEIQDFLAIGIRIPALLDQQVAIGKLYTALGEELLLLDRYADAIERQKRAVLEGLLSSTLPLQRT